MTTGLHRFFGRRAALALLLALAAAPGCSTLLDEKILGPVTPGPQPITISGEEQRFHQSLFIADLHADTLASDRDITGRPTGHVSFARLREGNVALQAFTVFTITPVARRNGCVDEDDFNYAALLSLAQLRPPRLWFSPKARALDQARHLVSLSEPMKGAGSQASAGSLPAPCANRVSAAEEAQVNLVLVRTADDLANLVRRRANGEPVLGGFLGLEGAHALEGSEGALQPFYDAGSRMIALTHRFNNSFGGASEGCPPDHDLASPAPEMGLTELGRRLLIAAVDAHMIIDLAHASSATIKDVTTMPELAGHAMLISHTGVRFTCPPPQGHVVARNIADDDIRAVARTGGVIGVGFWPEAVCWTDAEGVTQQERVDAIVRAMAHIVTVLASPEFATEMHARRPNYDPMDHIAFGSDFDGAVKAPFDVGGLGLLTASMLRFRDTNGQTVFDERAVRKIAGINVCRILMTELPGGNALQAQETCEPLMKGVATEQPRRKTVPD